MYILASLASIASRTRDTKLLQIFSSLILEQLRVRREIRP